MRCVCLFSAFIVNVSFWRQHLPSQEHWAWNPVVHPFLRGRSVAQVIQFRTHWSRFPCPPSQVLCSSDFLLFVQVLGTAPCCPAELFISRPDQKGTCFRFLPFDLRVSGFGTWVPDVAGCLWNNLAVCLVGGFSCWVLRLHLFLREIGAEMTAIKYMLLLLWIGSDVCTTGKLKDKNLFFKNKKKVCFFFFPKPQLSLCMVLWGLFGWQVGFLFYFFSSGIKPRISHVLKQVPYLLEFWWAPLVYELLDLDCRLHIRNKRGNIIEMMKQEDLWKKIFFIHLLLSRFIFNCMSVGSTD